MSAPLACLHAQVVDVGFGFLELLDFGALLLLGCTTSLCFLRVRRLVFIVIFHDVMALHIVHIKRAQELIQRLIALLQLLEELLGVRPSLRRSTRAHMLLHVLPVFAVQLERLEETEVLFLGPTALVVLYRLAGSQIMASTRLLAHGLRYDRGFDLGGWLDWHGLRWGSSRYLLH